MTDDITIADKPIGGPAGWRGPDITKSDDWIYRVSANEISELQAALKAVKARGLAMTDITREDFPLPTLGPVLREILTEIETGRGFCLIRGLPVERWGKEDSILVYWGIGQWLGTPVAQNMMGELLGDVRAAAADDWNENHNVRGYQTTVHLPFHCDKSDVVGLLCLQTAKAGGTSNICSTIAIHDEILKTRPDLLAALYQPFCIDHRGEEFPGEDPFYIAPTFAIHQGRFFSRFGMKYVESAQRFPQVPRLTEAQKEGMELFNTLAQSDELRLDMTFEQGDIQLLNNHLTVHSRTDYEDWPEPERKRHLVRMLLFTDGFSDDSVPPDFAALNAFIRRWGAEPRESVLEGTG